MRPFWSNLAALVIALFAFESLASPRALFAQATTSGEVIVAAVPDGLESHDIGGVGAAGSSELVGTRLIVRGSGADVWGTADEFHFAETTVSGDFELVTQVTHVENIDRWTKAGIMIRDGLAANARHAFLLATPRTERGVAFQRRPTTGGTSVHTSGPAIAPPVWLRLTRRGDVVLAAARASDTDPWTELGQQSFSDLPPTVNVGFAVSSHVDGVLAEAWFEDITLESLLPEGFEDNDIGNVGAEGTSEFDGTTWTISGAGADVWNTADAFHFTWQVVSGDFDVETLVTSVENVNVWTKAGLMMRETLDPGSRHAFVLATPTASKGVAFQRRTATGGSSVHTSGGSFVSPVWLRLVRTGNAVRAFRRLSAGDPWTLIGLQTFSSLQHSVMVGFAVSSHVRGRLAAATFEEFKLTTTSALGWESSDVGAVGAPGSSSIDEDSGPEFTVSGSGADVWGTADEFHFLSREVTGDFDFAARAVNLDDLDKWTKSGLMMRESLAANARHAFIIQTPRTERGVAFQRRVTTGGPTVHTAGPLTAPEGFLRLVREGDVVSAYHKTEAEAEWTLIGSQTFTALPPTMRVGFAVSSHVDGTLATAVFDNVVLTN